jgi:putative tryptophan/tyrosine transport system substrate-binding protein
MRADMRRREFLTLLGGAATAWPLATRAQQPQMPVIGLLGSGSLDGFASRVAAFKQGLTESGYIEGQNVSIEYRWAEGHYDRLPAMATDLVSRNVAVIVAIANVPAALAAKAATTTTPIVFTIGADPVDFGVVQSLNRPGGNITGVSVLSLAVETKKLELLHELVPKAAIIGILVNPTNPNAKPKVRDMNIAANALAQNILVVEASTEREIDAAFTILVQKRISALVVVSDTFFNSRPQQLVALTDRHSLPAIYPFRDYVEAGGLMSYGPSAAEGYRNTGIYTGRVLNGEKPADLPVMQSTKFEFVINLKTAKALGLDVPLPLQLRADEMIE